MRLRAVCVLAPVTVVCALFSLFFHHWQCSVIWTSVACLEVAYCMPTGQAGSSGTASRVPSSAALRHSSLWHGLQLCTEHDGLCNQNAFAMGACTRAEQLILSRSVHRVDGLGNALCMSDQVGRPSSGAMCRCSFLPPSWAFILMTR